MAAAGGAVLWCSVVVLSSSTAVLRIVDFDELFRKLDWGGGMVIFSLSNINCWVGK